MSSGRILAASCLLSKQTSPAMVVLKL
jgi:hypothetical protein